MRMALVNVQVDAFRERCKHAIECIRALQLADNTLILEDNCEEAEERMFANNIVVDKKLGGREVTV